MGTVPRLLAEHVSLRVRSVDRHRGSPATCPDLTHEGGLVAFLLAPGLARRDPPHPLARAARRRTTTGMRGRLGPPRSRRVRAARGALQVQETSKETDRPALPARLADEGRAGLVLVGKAQERDAGLGRLQRRRLRARIGDAIPTSVLPPVEGARPWYFYLFDHEWGPAFFSSAPTPPTRSRSRPTATSGSSASSTRAGVGYRGAGQRTARASRTPSSPSRLCPLARRRTPPTPHRPLAPVPAEPAHRRRSRGRLRLGVLGAPDGDLRHPCLRPPPGRPGLVRGRHQRPPHPRATRQGPHRLRPPGPGKHRRRGASPPTSSLPASIPASRSATSPRGPRPTSSTSGPCGWRRH